MYKGLCIWVMRFNPCILYHVLLNNKRMDLSSVNVGRCLAESRRNLYVFSLVCMFNYCSCVCAYLGEFGSACLIPNKWYQSYGGQIMVTKAHGDSGD